MKIKEDISLDLLLDFGFKKLTKTYFDEECINEDHILFGFEDSYVFDLGHSRRGQHYYYLVTPSRDVEVIATKPDGAGSSVELHSVILELYKQNLLE